MVKWRFKTKEEFIRENLWVVSDDFPKGWNNKKLMNYLLGTEISDIYHTQCEQGATFKFDGRWTVTKDAYKKVMQSEFSSNVPQLVVPGNSSSQSRVQEQYVSEELPQFDLDRLAKEIDTLFQEKINHTCEVHNELGYNFLLKTEEKIEHYREQVDKIFKDIKESLIAEIQRGHTTIVMPNLQEIDIQHMDHPEMKNVIVSLVNQKKAMLVGPAGTGKTYMVAEIAKRLDLPFYKYSCSRDSSVHDLIGYKQPQSETYLETVFLKAYEHGGIFLVDEYDAMSGDMSLFFNGVADASKFISIPHRDNNPIAEKHKDFYIVMCGNTWGKGSIEFSGRDFQDMALMDRFRFCRHHIGYHFALEQQWMANNYKFAQDLRTALEQTGSYLSTRNIEDIANLIRVGVSKTNIVDTVLQDVDKEGQKAIKNHIKQYV